MGGGHRGNPSSTEVDCGSEGTNITDSILELAGEEPEENPRTTHDKFRLYTVPKESKNVVYKGVIALIMEPRPQDAHVMYIPQEKTGLSRDMIHKMDIHRIDYRIQPEYLKLWNREKVYKCWIICKVERNCTRQEEAKATSKLNEWVAKLLKKEKGDWNNVVLMTMYQFGHHLKHDVEYMAKDEPPSTKKIRADRSQINATTSEDDESMKKTLGMR